MTRFLTCLGVCLVAALVTTASAQQPRQPYEPAPAAAKSRRAERPRSVPAEYLIHQRAVYQARQRLARIELRKWQGVSRLRPAVGSRAHAADLNGLAYTPWDRYWTPVWLWTSYR